jgi:peptidoglycan/LPS O-acetylase OafA/YrhL
MGLSVALLQSWIPGGNTCFDGPAWSLSIEAAFYVAFPVLALLIGRLSVRSLALLTVMVCLLYLLMGQAMNLAPNGGAFFPVFILGMLAGRLYSIRGSSIGGRFAPAAVIAAFTALVLIGIGPYGTLFVRSTYLLPVLAVLLFALAVGGGWIGKILASPALVALGEASYGLYIVHWPVLEWYTHLLGVPFGEPAANDRYAWPLFIAYLVAVVALSLWLYRVVEVPARRIIRGWGAPRRTSPQRVMPALSAQGAD